jgi:[protein-PII] uridylyltransferase
MTAASGFHPAVARAAAALAVLRERIAAQHAAGAPGVQTCGLATDLFDAIVLDVWRAVLADLPAADARLVEGRVAVVAHGGYGRREMAPWSDVDLMLLHEAATAPPVEAAAKRLLQHLFDAGLDVGQSVRTVGEACRLAAADATILSSLLDGRLLAGDAGPFDRLAARLRSQVRRAPRRTAERLIEARGEESAKFGQTVSLLEPNVKRSPGGLRDIQLIRWLGRVHWGESSFEDLALLGAISRRDAAAIRDAREFLMRLRNDLHLGAGKCIDDLTRDEQLRIAAARGIDSQPGLLGVERFMREYFHHTKQVAHIVESVVLGIRRPDPLRGWLGRMLGHRIDGLFRVGPLTVGGLPGRLPRIAGDLPSVIRLLELSMLYDMPVEHETWEAVRAGVGGLDRPVDEAVRQSFLALFSLPGRLGGPLRRLHEVGLLERVIPQFAHARHLLQFNNYHKYTVDEHCILAVERAVGFADDRGWLGAAWRQLKRKRTVLLALLVHDLGKGYVEDHSEVGARIARDVAASLGLPADEAEIVEFLVLKHLAMAHLAFRRDSGDDSLVVRFARDVGSPEVLRMLAVLTAADVSAVGPGTWTQWKADLLGDLYHRTLGHLDGESPSVRADRNRRALEALLAGFDPEDPVVRLARDLPLSYLHATDAAQIVAELRQLSRLPRDGVFVGTRWEPATSTVAITVGTREDVAPGVFHRLTGAITSQRLEILAADIHTLDGCGADGPLVIDHFVVQDPDFAGEPPGERIAEITAAIRASLKGDEAPSFTRRWNPFAPRPNPATLSPPRVLFDNESSEQSTILEVFAPDSVGLLYAIAKAIFEAGLSVRAAKIGTTLDQVVDAFHLTDRDGGKIVDPARLAALRRAIERVATPITGPTG